MSLLTTILKSAIFAPRTTAVVDDQRTYSYSLLGVAAFFMAGKIARESSAKHVGILLPTSGGFVAVMLGCWVLGRVPVPLNFLLKKDELNYVIEDSDIDTIITVGPMLEFLGGREVLPEHINVVELSKDDFKGLPRPRLPKRHADDDLAVILYTSGTSGKPKGVMLSHGNLQNNVESAIEHAELTGADTFLGVLPQFHSFGLTALTLIPLALRTKVVYTARFIPKKIVELAREHRPEVFMGVPSMYGALLSVKGASKEDFASIRIPISGGEPLSRSLYERCRETMGLQILEGYGLTETSPIATWSTPKRWKEHSVGRALPGVEIIVVDEQDEPVATGVDGEILIAGPNVMQGYYKQPEMTAEAIQELKLTGYDKPLRVFRTGDMGHLDEDGFLFITGRKKEMLIIGGENVFPREIEEVIDQHERVHASAVVGKADDIRGEVPVAYVELAEGQEDGFDEGSLRQFCRDRLAGYKVPREVHVLHELPRNPTGKILRKELMGK